MGTWRVTAVAAIGVGLLLLGGCGDSVSASTTCSDFLNLDEQTQQTAVETLAARTHGDAFKGPMGIDNVLYDCQESPNKTLGRIMGLS